MAARQCEIFLAGVAPFLDHGAGTFWVNPPASDVAAQQKACQLRSAARAGLKIPETLISNDPAEIRAFWQGWLAWSREQGIDYFIGRRLPAMLSRLGLGEVRATAETALYHGGSAWAEYWRQTVTELRPRLVASGQLDDRSIDTFLAQCAEPAWWTQTIAFTAVGGRVPASQ